MSFLHFRKLLFFSHTSYPGEIAYFNSPNRELSNGQSSEISLSFQAKNYIGRRAYMVTYCIVDRFGQVRTGLDKSEQVWSAVFPQPWVARCPNLAHRQTCVQFSSRTSLETLQPSEVVETALCHASVGIRCELVWSATFLGSTSKSDTSLLSSRLAEFKYEISPGYDRRQIKLWLSIIPALRWSSQRRLG